MVSLQFVLSFLFCVGCFAQEHLILDQSQLGDVIEELKLLRKEVEENRKHIHEQESELKALKLELRETKSQCNCGPTPVEEKSESEKKELYSNGHNSIIWKGGQSRINRIIPPTYTDAPTSHDEPIAFYAYMSASINNLGEHHILIFDVIKSNSGLGLHPTAGVFTAPKSGFYVFTWTIRVYNSSHHGVELIVNGQAVGAILPHSGAGDNDTGSTTAVVHVIEGEDVFLRTTKGSYNNAGPISSDRYGYSSFAGWKLS